MTLEDLPARDRSLADVHRTLIARGVLVPLARGRAEQRRWADCDLAAFAENRLGVLADPLELGRSTRERWSAKVLEEPLRLPRERKAQSCYWIIRKGEIAGTMALSTFCLGSFVNAYSVYVRPSFRGAGVMAHTLRVVREELETRGLGLVLETPWTWQPAVRFYRRNGFWLRSWKRDLAFIWRPDTPPPVLTVSANEASLAVESDGRTAVLARARRQGKRLIRLEGEAGLNDGARAQEPEACTTLSLAIALAGWPLIRSDRLWEQIRCSDLVHPEGLAHRIQEWEAWSVARGWRVETPRIPGLAYPTWAELEG